MGQPFDLPLDSTAESAIVVDRLPVAKYLFVFACMHFSTGLASLSFAKEKM